MLLRIISSIVAIIIFSGFQQTEYPIPQKIQNEINRTYKISVLSLFSPQTINVSFPEKVFVKIDNDYLPIQTNKNITIKKYNDFPSHKKAQEIMKDYQEDCLVFDIYSDDDGLFH